MKKSAEHGEAAPIHSVACIMHTDACTATAEHPDMQLNGTADTADRRLLLHWSAALYSEVCRLPQSASKAALDGRCANALLKAGECFAFPALLADQLLCTALATR